LCRSLSSRTKSPRPITWSERRPHFHATRFIPRRRSAAPRAYLLARTGRTGGAA
jgi:hypothetical protein